MNLQGKNNGDKIGAVIVAAGFSSRMGSFKPLLDIEGKTFAQRIVDTLFSAGVEEIVMVTGYRGEELERHMENSGVIFVRNDCYADTQMLDSVKLGLERLLPECGQILLTPVDVPLFSKDTVRALIASDAQLALPICNGETGHPILMAPPVAEQVLSYTGENGLSKALECSGIPETYVDVDDPGILQDADTPEEYEKVLEQVKQNAASKTDGISGRTLLGLLLTILLLTVFVSLTTGRYPIKITELSDILLGKLHGTKAVAFWNVRFPRILLAVLVGGGLSLAGATFQGVFRNPIASPDILGASAGAGFGAALAIFMGFSRGFVTMSAFVASFVSVGLVFAIGRHVKGDRTLALVLAGIIISSLFQAGTSYIKIMADPADRLPAITYWLMGSLAGADGNCLRFVVWPLLVGTIPLFLIRWRMNLLTMGEEEARSMGVDTGRTRMIAIVCASLITAATVSVSGIISWVGLVVPHMARKISGSDYRVLLPSSMILGSTFLLVVDDLSRNISSSEIPLGILTAAIGAPFFLLFVTGKGKRND